MPHRASGKKKKATSNQREFTAMVEHAKALRRGHPAWSWADAMRAAASQRRHMRR